MVGSTLGGGAMYQRVNFHDELGPTPKLIVSVGGPPEAVKLTGKRARMEEQKEQLLAEGYSQAEVAKKLRVNPRTVWERHSQLFPHPPP